jgi:hypothetical protein
MVSPASDDHVFHSIGDGEPALAVEVPKVAGPKPAIGDIGAVVEARVLVTDELIGPLHHHLAADAE